jgi:hypothetical protein
VTSRDVARVARALADQQADKRAEIPTDRMLFLTVAVASPLTVSWRGANTPVDGKNSLYTPTVGDRVMCVHSGDQLIVLAKIV